MGSTVKFKPALASILLSIIALLCGAAPSFAQSVLDFPRVISKAQVFTGIAISNPTSTTAAVTFAAYQPDGSAVSGSGIQHPVTTSIPAGGQIANQFSEIFGGPSDFDGWIQATSTTSGLTGF